MSKLQEYVVAPDIQLAIVELQELIRSHYSTTAFTVGEAEDPDGIYMRAIVDVDDPEEVTQVFIDRMIDLQVEDGLPIYVVPVCTRERIVALHQWQWGNGRSRFRQSLLRIRTGAPEAKRWG